jgi:hypothetical protein
MLDVASDTMWAVFRMLSRWKLRQPSRFAARLRLGTTICVAGGTLVPIVTS